MWVHYAEPETKAQPKHWKRAASSPSKMFMLSPSAGKVMPVAIWDSRRMILANFMPKSQPDTPKYCSEIVLKTFRENLK